jgi:radical SAM protein with 4Fe4S-binding SPASM domain
MMHKRFYVYKGWLGTIRHGFHFLYHVVDKKFTVFKALDNSGGRPDFKLEEIDTTPEPDFICEANAAAITLTTKCNMNCGYCYVKPAGGSGNITPERAKEAVKALGEQTNKELILFAWGGEPTQNPGALIAMLEEALKYPHIKVSLITNGVIEYEFLKKLLAFKNLVFQISFDGLINHDVQKPLLSDSNSLCRMLKSVETISMVSRRLALRATVTRDNVAELNTCLLPTVRQYTNRVMLEHLHTYNGRARSLKENIPSVEDYVNLVFNTVPAAEQEGIHVKVLPLDHLRAGGPNNKMNFLNILPNGEIVVSNAIIHHKHKDFRLLNIGKLVDGKIYYNQEQNDLLVRRYMNNYRAQCKDCAARVVCRGSVQRYLFITNDTLSEWDNMRCKYFIGILERWMDEQIDIIYKTLYFNKIEEYHIQLIAPEGKVHYPMFIMENGLLLLNRES